MSQLTVDPKAPEPGNGEIGLPGDPKQQPVAVKKTPLRDLPNENNIAVTKSTGNSMLSKERDIDCTKVGTKRPSPDSPANPNSVNGHLVYVRRKAEAEVGKNTTDEITPDKPQLKESSVACFPAVAPIPAVSSVNYSSGKPSVPLSINRERMNKQNWEERYIQLQMFLNKLQHSSPDEYLEKLRALPAAELSRHAVELEKRSIQLSLEEGIELKRVKALDVLGKSKNPKSATPQPEPPQSLQQT